ncbi:aldo/keto reductase [Sphingomonas pruni]|uniref:aldo/keto reductase n=1 Tax=Sphingomonas pruni TaxID=40683 RepID=UPI0008297E68|nr:aldo/keto reductase [Sphingomonas pruni]
MMDFLTTPTVALGTWAWGDSGKAGEGYFGSGFGQAGLDLIADRAFAAGLNLWDTAAVYGMGRAETILGRVLSRFPRSDYRLSTKFTPQAAGPGDNPVADMLDQSLARLGLAFIDLYWIHNPLDVARWTPLVVPLLESGKVKHVGLSNHDLSEIEQATRILGRAGFTVDAIQGHYSLLHRGSERAGILDYCRDQEIPFLAYMVLEQGALSGKYSPEAPLPEGTERAKIYNGMLPQLKALTDRLASMGEERGVAASEVAIAWAISKGTTPIIGVTHPAQVDGFVRAAKVGLSGDEIAELEVLAGAAGVNTRGWWEKEMEPEL